jgi:hypothetical protein
MPDGTVTVNGSTRRVLSQRLRALPKRRSTREIALLAIVIVVTVVTAWSARWMPFKPGSTAGYWIGVSGGSAMLLLFLYPLRKRWKFAARWGKTRWWFAVHMVLGVAGPLLIVLHSKLQFGSLNATMAFASMALVATSGIVGRYLYSRIHHGLYGQRASLADVRAEAGLGSIEVRSKLAFAPRVEERLERFAEHVELIGHEGLRRPWRFFALGVMVWLERWRSGREVTALLRKRALAEGWTPAKLARRRSTARLLVAQYLRAVQRLAQFTVFERLFSWWHVLHVPLVYMLVLTTIAHVIAVHMY